MKFGFFDDSKKEYVITSPKTPYPWINYLGTQEFFSLISNTAGGYHFYKDARLRRITRYRYNNVPVDMGGRYFYINDNGTIWAPGWSPVKTELDGYECRHGMGYTIIKGTKNNISAEVTFFVPQNYNGEIQKMTLKNEGGEAKKIKLFSLAEWCLWNAQDDSTNFQRNFNTGEVEIEGSTIYHKTEYKERRNHYAFYTVNADIDGYDTDREAFLGLYNGFENPQVVAEGLILLSVNQTASGTDSGWGILLVLCAAFGWVTGSFLSKKQASETQLSVIQTSGLLMFIGGLQSLVGAAVLGEFSTFSMDSVTPLSAGALLYLVIFGAIIAYTCYFWLLLHTRTVVAISYEYVNPVIGVFLGWLLAGEQVDGVIVTACCLTVLSVFFIVSRKHG